LEHVVSGPSVEAFIAGERLASPELDGRSVFGWERELQEREKRRNIPASVRRPNS
jgi:uncharacterized protein